MNKKDYDIEYQRNNVVRKAVTFNRNNGNDMRLLKAVERTGNANAWIKELIREAAMRYGVYNEADEYPAEFETIEEAQAEVDDYRANGYDAEIRELKSGEIIKY